MIATYSRQKKLHGIKNQYPYSYYATPAELLLADILYKQENYVESAAAYMMFRDFHPKHAQIPYVVFKIAESFYKQLPDTFDRDLEAAVEAITYYNELLRKYPDSEYVKDSHTKIAKAKSMLESKEKYIADFYFKTEVYEAARWRYLDILDRFSDEKFRSHAMTRIIQASYHLKEYNKCLTYNTTFTANIKPADMKKANEYTTFCKNKL